MGEDVVFLARELSIRFDERQIVSKGTFSVKRGEALGIVGERRSGKSSIVRALAGLVKPSSGDVLFHAFTRKGVIECEVTAHQDLVRRSIGIVDTTPALCPELTVHEHLDYIAQLYNLSSDARKRNIEVVVRLLELRAMQHMLIRKCPETIRVRTDLACALVHSPAVLIVDGLQQDPWLQQHIHELFRRLRSRGMTIIITGPHEHELRPLCDRLLTLKDGSLIAQQHNQQDTRLIVSCDSKAHQLVAERLRTQGMVVAVEGTSLAITTPQPHRALRTVLEVLDKQNVQLLDARIVPAGRVRPLHKDHSLIISPAAAAATKGGAKPTTAIDIRHVHARRGPR